MKRILILWLIALVGTSCTYELYDKAEYTELNFPERPSLGPLPNLGEVYLMTTFRSSKVLSRVIDEDTVYDDISIPIYTTAPSKDTIQSAYLIFNKQTEKVCYKVTVGNEPPGHLLYYQREHSGCDLFGKYSILEDRTLGLNLMNDESMAFHISCKMTSSLSEITQVSFDVIDYKNGLSETQGSTAPPISFDQVFHTQMDFVRTDLSYVYLTESDETIKRSSIELQPSDRLTVQTKKGKIRRVIVKGYAFYLK
ncbi:MAG: hypothetical protein ABJF11_13425 [Reichenbachiella sp.]|uniref:hypothetical protein n=1 Tax=Reichenbachiella sp. TaxID=2184521 RepID=UPI003266F7C5